MRNVIQVLVVVLIAIFCGGIFAVFVVQVRDAAARSQCTNNLKLLGLAVENYFGTYAKYPTAAEKNPELPPEKRLSWIVGIYPFVEASDIYNKIDHKKGWDAEENRFAALIDLRILHCPGYPEGPPVSTLVPTHYLGISGIGDDAIALPREDPDAGIFGYDRPVELKDFKRGRGETFLIVETSRARGAWTSAGSPTTRGLISDGSPYIGVGAQFGGNHRSGANITFADASVRLIDKSIDPVVFESMATLRVPGHRE